MPQTGLTPAEVKAMLLLMAERVIAAEPILSEADRNLGDGDHGLGMQRGLTAAREKLLALPDDGSVTIDKLFSTVGMAMMSSMGGASGAIFGTLFRDGGRALAGKAGFAAPELAAFLRAACDGVMTRGKANPGDKTMVDALHPAATQAEEAASLPLPEALAAAAAAAAAGRDASKDMIAVFGRARGLGEGARGFPDAGAISVTVILDAMREYVDSL
ncbi:MAG: dihydroxyacetone kinase subunit DhaL [Verrucomicrobiales bacterium]